MREEFVKQFANTVFWKELKEGLYDYKETIENVNDDSVIIEAKPGEKFVGKQYAGKAIENFIGEIDKFRKTQPSKKKLEDNFN